MLTIARFVELPISLGKKEEYGDELHSLATIDIGEIESWYAADGVTFVEMRSGAAHKVLIDYNDFPETIFGPPTEEPEE